MGDWFGSRSRLKCNKSGKLITFDVVVCRSLWGFLLSENVGSSTKGFWMK